MYYGVIRDKCIIIPKVKFIIIPKVLFCIICRNCWRAQACNKAKENVTIFSHPLRDLLEHGSTYIGINAALCGLIANSLFRRVLNVTQARISAGLPMAVIPFLTANASYKAFVSLPLNTGKFDFIITSLLWYMFAPYSNL